MENYSTAIILEIRSPIKKKKKEDPDKYPVKLRVIIDRKARYYGLGYYLTETDFKKVYSEKPRKPYKKLLAEFTGIETRADHILKALNPPTLDRFKRLFTQKGNGGNVGKYYHAYIDECRRYDRHGTADNYHCSLTSLNEMKNIAAADFKDVTPDWLKDYERKMLQAGKSISTIGIYLRPLRFLYNRAINDGVVPAFYYPFGRANFEIPSSENTKRPLSRAELEALANYSGNPVHRRYRDFFMLSFYLVGLNFYDLLTLQWKQLHENTLTLIRAKTRQTTRKKQKPITLKLNPDAMDLITMHGTGKGKYIFDIVNDTDPPEVIRQKVGYFVRNTNQALKAIAKKVNSENKDNTIIINPKISTVFARHSAASHGLKSGASIALISKSLGHSNISVTSNYISTLDNEEKFLAEALQIKKRNVPETEQGTDIPETK